MTDYYFKNIGQSQLISQSQIDMRSDSEMDLDQIVLKELTPAYNRTLNVPMFVINCIEYLEQHGLQKIGLFRVSTSKRRVKQVGGSTTIEYKLKKDKFFFIYSYAKTWIKM